MRGASDHYSEFGYYIHRVVALIDRQGDAMFRRELGLGLAQFNLLRFLEASPEVPSQQQLADRLGIAKSAVSRQIDIARRSGWIAVAVSESSRRQHTLTLTPAGRELLSRAKTLIEDSEITGFRDLPEADVEATVRTLKALHEKLTAQP
ncbi:MarR family winged helix-turn-helix transcriptional regulator [Nocardia sp. NPDC088792]|uniref:MarR family winged helix-turn-helix transcriptional regulator n=1 Tax=Nocardia sp. NPDC088792 TaxID=3364332 RepID=UPI00380FC6C2